MENFFKNIDNFSGQIYLKHKGKDGYKNMIGGWLSLLVYALTFSFSILFLMNLLNRVDPKSYTVKKFLKTGGAVMDQNNLFHWLRIIDYGALIPWPIDVEYYKDIIEIQAFVTSSLKINLIQYSYGRCVFEDFSGIETFYNKSEPNFIYCLRKMKDLREESNITNSYKNINNSTLDWKYNLIKVNKSIDDKTYTNESILNNNINTKINNTISYKKNSEFIYPWITIEKPEEQTKKKFFKIQISTCQNSTDKDYVCKPQEEIDKKIASLSLQVLFIDNMFDVGNYKEPISKYINTKSVAIRKNNFSNLFINFLAVNIITRDGFVFDTSSKLESYAFDFHSEAFTASTSNLIHQTQFWILANSQNYERSYPKLHNVAAEIAGLYRFFCIVAWIINFIFVKYTNFIVEDNLFELLNISFDKKDFSGKKDSSLNSKFKHDKENNDNVNDNNLFEVSNEINKAEIKFLKNDSIAKENMNKQKNRLFKNNIAMINKKLNANPSNNLNSNINHSIEFPINFIDKTKNIFIERKSNTLINLNLNDDPKSLAGKSFYSNQPIKKEINDKSTNRKNVINNNNNIKINNDPNSSNINNDNSLNILQKNEDFKVGKLNMKSNEMREAKKKTNCIANEGKLSSSKKAKISIESRNEFCKFIAFFFKCSSSKKLNYAEKVRNILLDEINIYKLHVNFIKLKKILKEELLINKNFSHVSVYLKDVYENY